MKPYFFINCFQNDNVLTTNKEKKYKSKSSELVYFTFLSESKKGNRIVLKFYDEFFKEMPDFYIFEFEKDDFPEKIHIPFYLNSNLKNKILLHYEIYDMKMTNKYFSGFFTLITKKFTGSLDVAFVCGSETQMNGIIRFKDYYQEDAEDASVHSSIWNNISNYHFDVLYHCGNYSKINDLYEIYKKNNSVLEIFSIFRKYIISYYQNQNVMKTLSSCWNFHFFNELDTIIESDENDERESSIQREFIYYLKIMYERYFCIPPRNNKNNFNYSQILGNIKLISLDCYLSLFYEKIFFSDNLVSFLLKNLDDNKINFIILSKPLRYLSERNDVCEKILCLLLELTRNYQINIISNHKRGYSYIQTHSCMDLKIDECICSGYNQIGYRPSFFEKIYIKYSLRKIILFDKFKKIFNSNTIVTDRIRHFGYNKNISLILSNFLINVSCNK
jgi:hypothetical protein